MLSLKIARKYLLSRKSYSAINLISAVAVLGIVVTTAAIVCVLSVFNGFNDLIMGKLAILAPPVQITASHGKMVVDADSVISVICDIEGVKTAFSIVTENALAVYGNNETPVKIKGVPLDYNQYSPIESTLLPGGRYALQEEAGNYALLSIGAAYRLQADPWFSDRLTLYTPRRVGRINLANPIGAFRSDSMFVAAVFQINQAEFDTNTIIIPLESARYLLDYSTEASAVEIYLDEDADLQPVMKQITRTLGPGYIVKDRLMQQSESYKMVNIEKWISFLLLAFIMLIATFNIVSTVAILIAEKENDIKILRTLGATKGFIKAVFSRLSTIITFGGTLVGIIIGVLLCLGQEHFGWIKLAGDANSLIVSAYPVAVHWMDIIAVFALTAIIALVAAVATRMSIKL